jgi:hypothetical protein
MSASISLTAKSDTCYAETMSGGGRKIGSKNRKGHVAGGKRNGAGRPSAEMLEKRAEEISVERDRQKRRKQEEEAQRSANGEEEKRKRKEVQKRKETEALNLIRKMAFDQRIRDDRYGAIATPPHSLGGDGDEEGEDASDTTSTDPAAEEDDDPALDIADGDDDTIEEADYETEDEGDGEVKARRSRIRKAYMPPINSPIGKILEATKTKVSAGYGNIRQMWIPPGYDPLTGNVSGPERYYSANLWQFIWRPFHQFRECCELNSVECIHGCGSDKMIQMGSRWRPMFKHGEIVWLMYDRVQCKSCKRYTSTIDPRFLAKLPTIVTERLPFITTATGPGIHVDMIYMLNSLKTKQILEGSFASMVNEVHRIRYDRSRIAYFDRMAWTAKQDAAGFYDQETTPPMFSSFNQPGCFGGIKLTTTALKAASNSYMKAKENYIQKSF